MAGSFAHIYLHDNSWRNIDSRSLDVRAINITWKRASVFFNYELVHVLVDNCSFPSHKLELRIRSNVLCIWDNFTVFVLAELLHHDRVKAKDCGGRECGAQKQLIHLFIVLNPYLLIFFLYSIFRMMHVNLPFNKKTSYSKKRSSDDFFIN